MLCVIDSLKQFVKYEGATNRASLDHILASLTLGGASLSLFPLPTFHL